MRTTRSLLLLLAGLVPATALAETFTVHPVIVCPDDGDLCGYDDPAAIEEAVARQLGEVNLQYEVTGISYRVGTPEIVESDTYAMLTSADGMAADGVTSNKKLVKGLVKDFAANRPGEITLFLKAGLDKCWNALPCPGASVDESGDAFDGDDVVFCGLPSVSKVKQADSYAHELGHFWCLQHTHTADDTADVDPPEHDPDGWPSVLNCPTLPPVLDTPADPAHLEGYNPDDPDAKGRDEGPDGFLDQHEWCWVTLSPSWPGSAHDDQCTPECVFYEDGAETSTGLSPKTENAMSYYGVDGCRGPYWGDHGEVHNAFSTDQIERMEQCRALVPPRQALVDVCEGRGDRDQDGWCDDEDVCADDPDTLRLDDDEDGVPNACDLCDQIPSGAPVDLVDDADHDGTGDLCDPNADDDACNDKIDDDDLHAADDVGTITWSSCSTKTETYWVSESEDTDGDHVYNCADDDDDDDGIPDVEDPCTISAKVEDCNPVFHEICVPTTDWGPVCKLGECNLYEFAVISDNPDPTVVAVFDEWEMVGNRAYLVPPRGMGTLGAAKIVAGYAPTGEQLKGTVTLEVRSKVEHRTVARLATYEAGTLELGKLEEGRLVVLGADERGVLSADAAWSFGAEPGAPSPDGDRDGVPDIVDACSEDWDPAQLDGDADGFGDACDADPLQAFVVTEEDVELVRACVGVDLFADYGTPTCEAGGGAGDWKAERRQAECAALDLDQDGAVTERDVERAAKRLGVPVGPSGTTLAR